MDDDLAGKELLCPACDGKVTIPPAPGGPRPAGPRLELVEGLFCPWCGYSTVAELPPNSLSPDRGFRCLTCGANLRGKTVVYLVAIACAVGLLVVASGRVTLFGDDRDARIIEFVRSFGGGLAASLFVIPLYVVVLAFAGRQLLRPRPRRAPPTSPAGEDRPPEPETPPASAR